MHIQRKRIRSVSRYIKLPEGTEFYIGVRVTAEMTPLLVDIGFPNHLPLNAAIVPKATLGTLCSFNANGKEIKLIHDPKEKVYHSVWSTWNDWHGNPHSGFVNRSYERYPRAMMPAPGHRVFLKGSEAQKLVISEPLKYSEAAEPRILHTVNLFLELFGECSVIDNVFRPILPLTQRVSWRLLPPGERPWERIQEEIDPIIKTAKNADRTSPERLQRLISFGPDQIAVGAEGFSGYVAFTFTAKDITVLESCFYGNATYVLDADWEPLSKLTKSEIIAGNFAKMRVIHRDGWGRSIRHLLGNP